jgi:hypothetical protein
LAGFFLSSRSQAVRIGSMFSPITNCVLGVPQGFVLRPMIFLSVFVSLVGHLASSYQVRHQQYADKTQQYVSLSPQQRLHDIDILQRCLHPLHVWFLITVFH